MKKRFLLLVAVLATLPACQLFNNTSLQPPTDIPATLPATLPMPTIEPVDTLPPTQASTTSEPPASASAFPDTTAFTWTTVVAGLERPVDLQEPRDGSGLLFLLEKAGRIRILQSGQLLNTTYLDISDRVGSLSNEQGLLGLAFHPEYTVNGRFFVNYTDRNGNTVIARYHVTENPFVADPGSEVVLLRINQPFPNHNGGVLTFGPDGYLYAGLGDGGAAGDPFGNAQKLDTLLGKILRLNVDSADPYAIPSDNPYGNEIWAYGLRNPWRISFDNQTGDLFIGDVGQNQWEEIDFIPAGTSGGQNFGWDFFEGLHAYEGTPPQGVNFQSPIAEYDHSSGCSVTGGYVYRGTMPEWQGIYLYADYCQGTIWGLIRTNTGWQSAVLFEPGLTVTSFGQDRNGEIYLVSDSGQVLKLVSR